MARKINKRDLAPILTGAEQWIKTCLVQDSSMFSNNTLWTAALISEVHQAFVEHPDFGEDDFMTKLKHQMQPASASAQQLMAEMLWALLLFPSNMKARTKRQQITQLWTLSGEQLAQDHPLLADGVLVGVGSGGPGFNNYRPEELAFLVAIVGDLKQRSWEERQRVLNDYDAFFDWIVSVPQLGHRQFRHMLRFFAFPDRVERMSSNNDRRKILEALGAVPSQQIKEWSDRKLDEALLTLRAGLEKDHPGMVLDFYESPLRERWSRDTKVKTVQGEVTVAVPGPDEDTEALSSTPIDQAPPEVRQSIRIQSKLAEIGATMGFKVWVPKADKSRILDLISEKTRKAMLEDLPLNYDNATLDTIEQIDVLWLKGRSMARAFEVEHSTAVYSGLLRMADLLALQPNMDIRLHIVAPEERREKVFREMLRPVFSLLDRGPLARSCTFISYDSVDELRKLEHLAYTNDSVIAVYEERAEKAEL